MNAPCIWPETVDVINLVIKIVNNILSKSLYHRQFEEFFNEMETRYSDLLFHNKNDKWLKIFNYMVNFTAKLNKLNLKLQGNGNSAYNNWFGLEKNDYFYRRDSQSGKLLPFQFLKQYRDKNQPNC
ncbi:EPM2AIP1 [Cordylochernes scorpioides]|uniref:EPM2AIP1 n=1 Tax=Cordylochernes scorpioides TaxID=51811 RepID=A0ABY6K3R3_9ARAC|nr:EPM2AIP1 [Cordylochernes scorpioides]